jgi:hypothetical protein
MNLKRKAIVLNCAICVGLLLEVYWGLPLRNYIDVRGTPFWRTQCGPLACFQENAKKIVFLSTEETAAQNKPAQKISDPCANR